MTAFIFCSPYLANFGWAMLIFLLISFASERIVMKLADCCHCEWMRFNLTVKQLAHYAPCYCSICRKMAGGGGYAIDQEGE
ncbi:hypothetical protein MO867_05760 [Microbulbifer sp. OS29]|uniref:CENP-V/GFA domain-containing protein n=1 Tax=Microbulbifer okhotskensis TaxID=2926617 RepID=A0A9X2EQK2_9GAMM|nr:hypothetical protein [Microbulbifer okhotskensis]MCO1333843.1 hypothetical protein [Microbulbifer okhotskensis]